LIYWLWNRFPKRVLEHWSAKIWYWRTLLL